SSPMRASALSTHLHGTPPSLLASLPFSRRLLPAACGLQRTVTQKSQDRRCELAAVGYREISFNRGQKRGGGPILMRRFMLRLCADLGFRPHHLAEAMRVVLIEPLVVALHALVAGGHHLPRVLLPGVERLPFFLLRQIGVLGDLVRRLVVICRLLELGLLRLRMRAHGHLMQLRAYEITNLER